MKNLHFDWLFRQFCDITEDQTNLVEDKKHMANLIRYSTEIYPVLNDITRLLLCYLIGITVKFIPNEVIDCEMSYL